MLDPNSRWPLAIALAAITCTIVPAPVLAQAEEQDDAPPVRLVAMTTFEVPYTDRAQVWSYMRDHYLPAIQLHPKVLNLRVMTHLYGKGGAEVTVMREVADWADINSPCGAPCEEYRAKHPTPEEGSPGWEEYAVARDLFQTYYSNHRDEIYSVIPSVSKIEGRVVGTVGPPPEEVASSGGDS